MWCGTHNKMNGRQNMRVWPLVINNSTEAAVHLYNAAGRKTECSKQSKDGEKTRLDSRQPAFDFQRVRNKTLHSSRLKGVNWIPTTTLHYFFLETAQWCTFGLNNENRERQNERFFSCCCLKSNTVLSLICEIWREPFGKHWTLNQIKKNCKRGEIRISLKEPTQ